MHCDSEKVCGWLEGWGAGPESLWVFAGWKSQAERRARQTEAEFEAEGGTRAVGSPGQGRAFGFEPGGSGAGTA